MPSDQPTPSWPEEAALWTDDADGDPAIASPMQPDQPTPARDGGMCGARTEPGGLLRGAICELLHGHGGWHREGGMSWTEGDAEQPRAFTQADADAAYKRGKAETLAAITAAGEEPNADELSLFVAEQMRDPAFVRAWWASQRAEQIGLRASRDAAYERGRERGKAEGRPSPDDVAILRKLLMSLPYWPTEAFAALARIEGVEPAEPAEPETEPADQPEPAAVVDVAPDPRMHDHEPPFSGIRVKGCAGCAAKLAAEQPEGSDHGG